MNIHSNPAGPESKVQSYIRMLSSPSSSSPQTEEVQKQWCALRGEGSVNPFSSFNSEPVLELFALGCQSRVLRTTLLVCQLLLLSSQSGLGGKRSRGEGICFVSLLGVSALLWVLVRISQALLPPLILTISVTIPSKTATDSTYRLPETCKMPQSYPFILRHDYIGQHLLFIWGWGLRKHQALLRIYSWFYIQGHSWQLGNHTQVVRIKLASTMRKEGKSLTH